MTEDTTTRVSTGETATSRTREGYVYGLIAYGWWGMVPLYFNLLKQKLGALDILAHRVIWSMAFLLVVLTIVRKWDRVLAALRQRNVVLVLATTSILIALNWLLYIYAVVVEQVVQASLGYYITPLVSVLLGMVFYHERLRRLQWYALGLATIGVAWLTFIGKEWPWIAVSLALSFSFYGLLRKRIPVDGLAGLSVETIFLTPIALAYFLTIWWITPAETWVFEWGFAVILFLSGIVTAIPLLCFGQAAQRLPLSTLGFLQYLAPTIQFLLAVWVLGERFEEERPYAFAFIWVGLILFSIDSYRLFRSKR